VQDSISIDKIYRVTLKSAKKAGKYLKKRFINRDSKINSFSKHDIKLDVDIETEHIIKSTIKRYFPSHGFICEESGLESISECNWIIDPLDGTVNFSKGIPHFCTSIAFKKGDKYLIGVVYDPMREELFSGIYRVGAMLNSSPIRRKSIKTLEEAVIVGGFFKQDALMNGYRIFEKVSHRVKKIRFLGSAALDLCYLACGRVNAYIQHSVNEWDIAAASLIAELSGVKIEIQESGSILNVFGADKAIFESLKSIIYQ
jgi:myo-inositol-1(or 4)-monophosphatase